jgi:hypothetical protein
MRILVAKVAAADEDSEVGRIFKTLGVPLFRRSFSLAQQPDTEVVFRFPRPVSATSTLSRTTTSTPWPDVEILHMLMG